MLWIYVFFVNCDLGAFTANLWLKHLSNKLASFPRQVAKVYFHNHIKSLITKYLLTGDFVDGENNTFFGGGGGTV